MPQVCTFEHSFIRLSPLFFSLWFHCFIIPSILILLFISYYFQLFSTLLTCAHILLSLCFPLLLIFASNCIALYSLCSSQSYLHHFLHNLVTGVKDYCERYGSNIEKICREADPRAMSGKTAEKIHEAMCNIVPVDKLEDRRVWRDKKLGELFKLEQS